MSADNGVYILECRDQFRVAHLQAIDNIYWSFLEERRTGEPVPTRVVSMFGQCKYTRDRDTALKVASYLLNKFYVCEYGIQFIRVPMTWRQVVIKAKELAPFEIKAIENGDLWENYKRQLDEIITYTSF